MRRCRRAACLPLLVAGLAVAAPAAEGRVCTVGEPEPSGCRTLQEALQSAQANPGPDEVRLRSGEFPSDNAAYAGDDPLEVLGAGAGETTIAGPLRLEGAAVVLRGVTLRMTGPTALSATGRVQHVRVTGSGNGVPGTSAVAALPGAPLVVDDLLVDATGLDAALAAPCAARLDARHATVAGGGRAGARAACADARLILASSIVAGGYGVSLQGAQVEARHSNLAEGTADGATASDPVPGDPGFVSATDLRLAPGSGLIDRGDPAPLAVDPRPHASEPLEDLGGDVRAADGDGDGRARRDVGAYERQAPPAPVPPGNVLAAPDAEDGFAPAWALTGGFTRERYGEGAAFPTRGLGETVGGGRAFFSGGTGGDATAIQVVDLTGQAAAVDAGGGRATLSGLLGGFRADGDRATVRATFRGPSGVVLGGLELAGPDAGARSNATTLLARSDRASVPPLTRSIEVVLEAFKAPGGAYTDAYFDNLGLELELGGGPGPGGDGGPGGGGPGGGGGTPLRPFAGVLLLSGRATLARRTGRVKLLTGCASTTVARCTGDLELSAVLVRGGPRVAVGQARVSLAPGGMRRVSLKLAAAARRYLRSHSLLRVRVSTRSVDGQGRRRSSMVPVVVRPERRSARR